MLTLNLSNHLEDELGQANGRLREFAHIVSHDLKVPLRTVMNLSQWTVEDFGDDVPAEIRNNLSIMQKRLQQMQALINGILQYARAGGHSGLATDVAVADVLQDILQDPVRTNANF